MVASATMAEDEERLRRITRVLKLNIVKRATVIAQIQSTYDMGVRVRTDHSLASVYLFHIADLDSLWHEFVSFDMLVLNCLFELNRADEYSPALRCSMRELVDVSKSVLTQIRPMGAKFTTPSNTIIQVHPTTCESIPSTSTTVHGQRTIVPSGRFSNVLSSSTSVFGTTPTVSRTPVKHSLIRESNVSGCNSLFLKLPLTKLAFAFGSIVMSPKLVRPYTHDLFRDKQLLPDVICATRDASGAHKWSLTCTQVPSVLKRVSASPESPTPPYVSSLHPVVFRQPTRCVRDTGRRRFPCPLLSVYIITFRRFRYVRSPPSLRPMTDVTSIVFLVIGPHESAKRYVSSRGHHIRVILLSIRDCFWQPLKLSINPADRVSRGIMPIVSAQNVYWCGTHGAHRDPSEWDDLSPSLSLCDLPNFLFSCYGVCPRWHYYRPIT
ncbi:unnamed protein product [Aphis gossypii]|uniref:Uncharacterized protein n=1 Tax=Aphis gossypii TaxID=80765 RepID=A0A9P0IXX3_APHGO|nr:unnamed protein product [Aphis gossypii]